MARTGSTCQVEIYSDGGSDPNPGPGGWGAILISDGHVKEISGGEPQTTNNRMELTAAIEALALLKRPCGVSVYTDSQYLRNGITQWVEGWRRRGWRKADGLPVENADLWQRLLDVQAPHTIEWHWIRGHRGNRWNEKADQLATEARRTLQARGKSRQLAAPPRLAGTASKRELPSYEVFARGVALASPGPAGYAAIVVGPQGEAQRSGGWPIATNHAMDLWAIIAALRSLPGPSRVTIHTPSKYVIDGATRWLAGWERSGWRTKAGQPVKHREIWQELSTVMGDHDVEWHHLPAADAEAQSARAASLAREEAQRQNTAEQAP